MKKKRVLKILAISFMIAFRRFRYDWGREIVVAISALILSSLFLYMFNDFIHTKVALISATIGKRLAMIVSGTLMALALYISRNQLEHEADKPGSLRYFLSRYGEDPLAIQFFLLARAILLPGFYFAVAWHFAFHYFWTPSLLPAFAMQTILFILVFIPLGSRTNHQGSPKTLQGLLTTRMSKTQSMIYWRLGQMLVRNRPAKFALAFALLFLLSTVMLNVQNGPVLLRVLSLLVASIFAAAAMALQVSEDLKCGWMEPLLGISHRMFVGSYYLIGALLGLILGGGAVLTLAFSGTPFPADAPYLTLQLMAIGLSCPLLMPGLIFQIDGRRPLLNIMTCSMIGLFVDTAIFAHPLAIGILPITIYYTDQHQKNRFYSSYSQQQ